ncbi:hypothetical protein [Streptomyces sp. NPDC055733]
MTDSEATARALTAILGVTATASTDEHGSPVIRVSAADAQRLKDSAPPDDATTAALLKEIVASREVPPT